LVPGCNRCFASEDREAFAKDLDVLVMLLPDTPATDAVVDAALLSQLAPGAIVINAGRANALDLAAAVTARESEKISALVLDVLATEPLPEDDPLWMQPGVYITSHTAAPTDMERIVGVFLDNLDRYRAGKPLTGAIDFTRGY
jgi:phosphoglycerate dehydrogenase-like enzyme